MPSPVAARWIAGYIGLTLMIAGKLKIIFRMIWPKNKLMEKVFGGVDIIEFSS